MSHRGSKSPEQGYSRGMAKETAASALDTWSATGKEGSPELGAALLSLFMQGREAWPALDVTLERFVKHVSKVAPDGSSADELASLSGEGLLLCAACLDDDPKAANVFETVFLAPLARVLGKLDDGRELSADTLQQLRAQFFAPSAGQTSAFLMYSGRGALAVWLKVLAVRAAQKLRRGAAKQAETSDDGLGAIPAPDADPELRFLKLQHRTHFKAVFAEALAALEPRERSVLRMSLVEGLSIDDIGKVYDVHRATAARWLGAAREQLVSTTRRRLAERLRVTESELDEMMGAVQSNLSLSLSVGLASKAR